MPAAELTPVEAMRRKREEREADPITQRFRAQIRAMPPNAMFWSIYEWPNGWHRTLWQRRDTGNWRLWASATDSPIAKLEWEKSDFPGGPGMFNPTMTLELLDPDKAAGIEMLMFHGVVRHLRDHLWRDHHAWLEARGEPLT